MTMTLMLMNELQISILQERANADHSMIQGKVGGEKECLEGKLKYNAHKNGK